ncbi:MAG TPA: hypothetical protein DEB25_09120 [Desulfobulbaceae bacterium]|nr:hypothetical protein [Desulfobulbaceae bacterium]
MEHLDYFATQKASLKNFGDFCRHNAPLVIMVGMALFLTHGVKLVVFSIGIDTELFLIQKPTSLITNLQIGRFGLAWLQSFLYGAGFNPVLGFAGAVCFTWLFTLSWCYIIALFSKNTGRNDRLIPFALLFMTSPIWAEQFYFVFQATEIAAMVFICPFAIYFLFKGVLENNWANALAAGAMLVFMISVYQTLVLLFVCGLFACFLLLRENSDYEGKVYLRLGIKLLVAVLIAIALYFFLAKIIGRIANTGESVYLETLNMWGKQSVWRSIAKILGFCYAVTIGNIPWVQDIAKPIIEKAAHGNPDLISYFRNSVNITSNALLLPGCLLFILVIIRQIRKKISDARMPYLLAGLAVPCCIVVPAMAGGAFPPVRTLFALPFSTAFMLFFLIDHTRKPIGAIITVLALLVAAHQGQVTAQLYYADYRRYQDDRQFARNLGEALTPFDAPRGFPLAMVGSRRATSVFGADFFQGQVSGYSFFEWREKSPYEGGERGVPFMRALGFQYGVASLPQMNAARAAALSMPSYPRAGSIKRLPDMIVVKLSASTYQPGSE